MLERIIYYFGIVLPGVVAIIFAAPVYSADTIVYEKNQTGLKTGGQVQIQFHRETPDSGDTTSDLFIRRLHLYMEATIHERWMARLHGDFSKSNGEYDFDFKDAYLKYSGPGNLNFRIGNIKFPFSREYLTSSQFQQLVERTFVGSRRFGVPERNVGIHIGGHNADKRLTWEASAAQAIINPDGGKLEFDTPINGVNDFDRGWMLGGRMDVHPMGFLSFSQGDFSRKLRTTIGIAGYVWENGDDKKDAGPASVDSIAGLEISGAVRGRGISVDAEYNRFEVDTVDSSFTSILYEEGETTVENWAVEGGYMMVAGKAELVTAYESQDADNYENNWNRFSLGANWYIKRHEIKMQVTYRSSDNVNGVADNDREEVFVQMQYVF